MEANNSVQRQTGILNMGNLTDPKLNVTNQPSMPTGRKWFYKNLEDCLESLGPAAHGPMDDNAYCNGTWDKVLCWPATAAGTTATLPCPPLRGLDYTKSSYKKCGEDGLWEGMVPGDYSTPQGWTNYSACYTPEAINIYNKFFGKTSSEVIKELAHGAKIMEMTGLSLSFVSLAISIFIFCYFRTLRCDRTRIHRNLFAAILIHVLITLILHADSFIAMSDSNVMGVSSTNSGSIYNTAVLCEILLTLKEYTKTVMFMWMFVEGMYLHNMLVVSVFSRKPNYMLYYVVGWVSPVMLTTCWAVVNGVFNDEQCWFGYTYMPYYWIIEGPRAAIIGVNLVFLLNIIRVLVTKLRQSNSTEAMQVRKAVKAAIVLLPLLGVCNFLVMVDIPKVDNRVAFAVWIYLSHFLISFQGFFIALIYCFLNGEVQHTVKMHWERYQQSRNGSFTDRRRLSRTMSIFTSVTEVPAHQWQQQQQTVPLNGAARCVSPTNYVPTKLPHPDSNGYAPESTCTLLQPQTEAVSATSPL